MKAADRLGAGTAFANARDPRNRAKAQAQGDIPMYDLVTLQLTELAPTPLNPREYFGTNEELLVLGHSLAANQITPGVAIPTPAYLKVWPEHTDQVSHAKNVLINGERRWRAAQLADLTTLDFTLRGDLAVIHDGDVQAARARILDAVLKENIDRQNFDPVEEARGVAALVAVCGDGVRAGQQLKRGKAWVSQRQSLLALPPELQREVSSGSVNIIDGRWMGSRAKAEPSLTPQQLLDLLREHHEEERRRKQEADQERLKKAAGFTAVNPAPARPAAAPAPASDPVTNTSSSPAAGAEADSGFTAVNPETSRGDQEPAPASTPNVRAAVVSPRSEGDAERSPEPDGEAPDGFTAVNPDSGPEPDWADPESVAAVILRRFLPKDIANIARILVDAYHGSTSSN
ncbi:ParB/RepB/Spo0J family partition protein [Streptacidiphilus sp. N1-3]|uniref:ParB/RepB/Spo0J family partition protein n=1 Tax=Streptacidiphilus alkalitolerans TaxID=3342712 RepID=A0ABV6XD68_9ACTN